MPGSLTEKLLIMKSPFKFLDSYTRDDREIFFGRDRETEELYRKVFESKTLVVYGVSGTGKTSLIDCGLANKFQDADWLPVRIRRGKDIVQSLVDGLQSAADLRETGKQKSNTEKVLRLLRSIYLDHFKPVYLIFDQFEEVFIFGTREERNEFARIIKSIADSELACRIIFSVREEYLASFTEMEEVIPGIMQNRFRVERMNRQNAISVIDGPCRKHGINTEEGFAAALLERVSEGGAGIELAYLQVYLDRLYNLAVQEREEEPGFTGGLLERAGSITDLLGTFLNEQVLKMEDPALADAILKSLVSAKGTKRQLTAREAAESVQVFNPGMKTEQVREMILSLVNLRILRGEDDEGRYELRHDSLAAKIFEKISADEMELLEVRQFIDNALLNYSKREIMLSPDDFAYIGDRENRLQLSGELKSFVDRSREHIRSRNRTVKLLTTLSAAALVILLMAIGKYVYDQVIIYQSDNLAYQSVTQYTDPEKRLTLAGRAYEMNPSGRSREALIKAFNDLLASPAGNPGFDSIRNIYAISFDPAPSPLNYAECIKTGTGIFGYTGKEVVFWDDDGSISRLFTHGKEEILNGKISADGSLVALLGSDSLLTLYDPDGQQLFSRRIWFSGINPRQAFAFTSKNGIITSRGKDVIILNSTGDPVQTLTGHRAQVTAIAISADNRFIASASHDSTIIIWYNNNTGQRYDIYNTIERSGNMIESVNFSAGGTHIITPHSYDRKVIVIISINGVVTDYPIWLPENKGMFSYAEFSGNDMGIVAEATGSISGYLSRLYMGAHLYKWYGFAKSQGTYFFEDLQYSPETGYYAYTLYDRTFLSDAKSRNRDHENHLLTEAPGKSPFFSMNGEWLYVIDGNRINAVFVSAGKIFNVIEKEFTR